MRRFLCTQKRRSNAPPFPRRSCELSEGLARRVIRRLLRIPGELAVRVGARLRLFDLCRLRFVGALDLLDRGCVLASALAGVGAIGVIHGAHLSRIPNRDRLLAIARDCLLNRPWGSKARMQFGECRRTDIRVVRCPSRLRAPWLQKRDVHEANYRMSPLMLRRSWLPLPRVVRTFGMPSRVSAKEAQLIAAANLFSLSRGTCLDSKELLAHESGAAMATDVS